MAPLHRELLIEEKIFGAISTGWAYFWYGIRQFILFFPALWAGYDRGRRKDERMKKAAEQRKAASITAKEGEERAWNQTSDGMLRSNRTTAL
jgi:hypothetical protein